MGGTPKEIENRLNAGEWLLPGDVAILLGVSRKTVDRMLTAAPPTIRHRKKPGSGRHRICNPEDVRRILDESRQEHPTEAAVDAKPVETHAASPDVDGAPRLP